MKNIATALPGLLLTGLASLLITAPVVRASYSFTSIANSISPTFESFGGAAPSINAAGRVAFFANLDAGGSGIFTSTGGAATSIALSSGPIFASFNGAPTINAAGTVAFLATRDAGAGGGDGIFTGTGGATTTIVLTSGPTFSELTEPAINAAGTVAFTAGLDAGGTGIFAVTSGVTTTIAQSGATFASFGIGKPSMNNLGTVAFLANLTAGAGGGEGIFTGAGGPTSAVALSSGPVFSTFFSTRTGINAAGTVAFMAILDNNLGGSLGMFTISVGGVRTNLALTTGPIFSGFVPDPSINTAGEVALRTTLDAGGEGIYRFNGSTASRVIGTGDALFGSTVTILSCGATGLNDLGQLSFSYTLANGTSGIAVASVPEPTSAALLVGGGALLALRRRRG